MDVECSSQVIYRSCRVCGEAKPLDVAHFVPCANPAYFARRCRVCDAAATREYWRTNLGIKARDRARRQVNREAIRAYDRMRSRRDYKKRKIKVDRWLKENPERARQIAVARAARRRARIKEVGGSFTADDIVRMRSAQKDTCWWCDSGLGGEGHVDHRWPVAKDGTNDPSNLVLSCPPCNWTKNDKTPWEFAGRLL
jgi:hypothetical protein